MEWTLGSILFYGGIAGIIFTLVTAIIVSSTIKKNGRSIIQELNAEYGGNIK